MLSFPTLSDDEIESLQKQFGSLGEHLTLLTAQSAVVHQRRHTLREQQRVHTASLSFLDVSHSFAESDETAVDEVLAFYEQSKSRFSHSALSLPQQVVEISPPNKPPPRPKRKSIFARLLDGKLPSLQPVQSRLQKRTPKHDRAISVTSPKSR